LLAIISTSKGMDVIAHAQTKLDRTARQIVILAALFNGTLVGFAIWLACSPGARDDSGFTIAIEAMMAIFTAFLFVSELGDVRKNPWPMRRRQARISAIFFGFALATFVISGIIVLVTH
jgi:formate/nitrite transporter FocA (FNT family)